MWIRRLLAVAVFCSFFGITFWYALVHTVHLGTLSVPNLRDLTVEEAEQQAHDMGLQVAVEKPGVFSATVPPGKIARQEPYAGFHVKTDSVVTVRLSLGGERTAIPEVRGESLQTALRALERSGLRPGSRAQVMHHGGGDLVIAADPPVGSEVVPTGEVDLLVNVAPVQTLWVMPDLLSHSLAQVRRFCRDNRLRLGKVHEIDYPGLAPGTVLSQYPSAGSPIARSDIVAVWVSR